VTARERLARWLPYANASGWLGDAARVIIPKLEREVAANARASEANND
jgi:hypothetical protein